MVDDRPEEGHVEAALASHEPETAASWLEPIYRENGAVV